jgi:tRNA(Ile)-lysidine synthase TilS/MesJ
MKICTNCVLPETFPGIVFNKKGVCNFCLQYKKNEFHENREIEYRKKFETLLGQYKGKNSYDALMCYSGGKDSTYTLDLLKEQYGLTILAFTFDNGFLPIQTLNNIRVVVENLGIDHLLFKPRFDILKTIFTACAKENIYSLKTIERASTICTTCMGLVKYSALRLAVEKQIPFIAFGWSPGQIPITSSVMRNNPDMVKNMQNTIFNPLHRLVGEAIKPYFLEESHFSSASRFPYNISPLAFLEYDEEKIYQKISKLGWESPSNTDANSTNCLLNSYANIVHKDQFHFHPYAFELANLVREGYISRDIALEKLARAENEKTVAFVRKKLGIL